MAQPFRVLCVEVLGADRERILPVGAAPAAERSHVDLGTEPIRAPGISSAHMPLFGHCSPRPGGYAPWVALPRGNTYAEGPNYRIELVTRTVICHIWKRADLTSEQGANCAEEMADLFLRLAGLPVSMVRGAIVDLRDAPHSWGPVTHLALGRAMMSFERVGRRLAVLTTHVADQRLMAMQIVRDRAPNHAAVFTDEYSAERWAATGE